MLKKIEKDPPRRRRTYRSSIVKEMKKRRLIKDVEDLRTDPQRGAGLTKTQW
jgi:hypothetical protein